MDKEPYLSKTSSCVHCFSLVSSPTVPCYQLQLTIFSMVISLFWLGWTVWDSMSPIIPSLGGIFFGLGFQLLFMGMTNYLTDVFRSHSASALGAAAMLRSIGATTLPLAADSMYNNLGFHWAPSVLAFIALAMGVIPFVFIRYGERLARSSKTAREAFAIRD